MLLELQLLDVPDCQKQRSNKHNRSGSNPCSDVKGATKRNRRDHDSAHSSDKRKNNTDVSIHAMEKKSLVPNEWYKLEAYKKSSGDDGVEMNLDTNFVYILALVGEAFARTSAATIVVGIAVDAVEVEEHHASERKAEEGAGEDEPEDEVVAFGEADWVVDFTGCGDEAVGRGASWCCHFVSVSNWDMCIVKVELKSINEY